uniref:Uncharacterized protein n=1 Tax=Spongospora subterranea TaxID=70186 RepID=A0A0H5RAI4_9EUKA|eukprot:CRZ11083.1 hypothetical protein [Spongospora subterranea]
MFQVTVLYVIWLTIICHSDGAIYPIKTVLKAAFEDQRVNTESDDVFMQDDDVFTQDDQDNRFPCPMDLITGPVLEDEIVFKKIDEIRGKISRLSEGEQGIIQKWAKDLLFAVKSQEHELSVSGDNPSNPSSTLRFKVQRLRNEITLQEPDPDRGYFSNELLVKRAIFDRLVFEKQLEDFEMKANTFFPSWATPDFVRRIQCYIFLDALLTDYSPERNHYALLATDSPTRDHAIVLVWFTGSYLRADPNYLREPATSDIDGQDHDSFDDAIGHPEQPDLPDLPTGELDM